MTFALATFLFLFVLLQLVTTECPFGTLRYEPEDGSKVQCYIVMKYHEIRFITMMLWREAFNTTEWHKRNTVEGHGWSLKNREKIYWEMDTVDSYPDALRMCSMIGELDPEAIIPDPQQPWNADIIKNMILGSTGGTTVTPMIKMPNFPVEWTTIPGDDVQLRLPTPMSMHHLIWIRESILFDGYYWTEKKKSELDYRDRGVLWLGIKKRTTVFNITGRDFWPKKRRREYDKKRGQCGLFYRPMMMRSRPPHDSERNTRNRSLHEGGVYFVQCADDWIEDQYPYYQYRGSHTILQYETHPYPGWHVAACEFDEPEDCIQRLRNETCTLSEKHNFSCVLAGQYAILRQPHQRFGKKCRENETDGMTIPCPKRLQYQCREDCRMSQWQNALGCLMPVDEKDNTTYYVCVAGDGEGVQFQVRRQVSGARYGGNDDCSRKPTKRTINCTCGGHKISGCIGLMLLIVIVSALAFFKDVRQ